MANQRGIRHKPVYIKRPRFKTTRFIPDGAGSQLQGLWTETPSSKVTLSNALGGVIASNFAILSTVDLGEGGSTTPLKFIEPRLANDLVVKVAGTIDVISNDTQDTQYAFAVYVEDYDAGSPNNIDAFLAEWGVAPDVKFIRRRLMPGTPQGAYKVAQHIQVHTRWFRVKPKQEVRVIYQAQNLDADATKSFSFYPMLSTLIRRPA